MKHSARKQTPLLLTCLALVWFSSIVSYAQDNPLNFERLSTENGLSSNVVYSIIQDSKGYLWIGTNEGLNRYDGYGFKTFRHIPGDSASLIANAVFSICEDSQGNIWAATQGGLCRFNYAKNNFTRIKLPKTDPLPETMQIIQVNKDELMIKFAGVSLLNIHTLETKKITIGGNNIDLYIPHPLSKDKKGNIYLVAYAQDSITSTNTVLMYDTQQKSFNKFLKFQPEKHPKREGCSYFFIDSRNATWIGTSSSGQLFHYSPGAPVNLSLNAAMLTTKQKIINKVFEDNDGNIWISTAKGVFLFDHSTGNFSNYPIDPSGTNATIVATTITQDRTGVIWIGTLNGLYKINPSRRKFRSITKKSGSKTALLNNFVLGIRPISVNKTMIEYYWAVPEFSVLDLPNQTIDHYLLKDYNYTDYLKKMILKNPEHFDEESFRRSLPLLQENKKKIENNYASSLLFDSQKHLWLLAGTGLKKLNPGESLNYPDVMDVQIWGDYIWMAGNANGLRSVHTPSMKLTEYLNDPHEKNSINSNNLNCLLIEQTGNIWIGTRGAGLDYFDRKKNIFQHYTIDNGLCNNSIFSMVKDDQGRLWVGTGNGLSCFDIKTKTFTNFFRSDGLVNSEFNRYSACKLSDGHILMGGMDGIDFFHPDNVLSPVIKPQVQITDFKVFNKSVFSYAGIRLDHDQNYVTVEFAAMDFRNPAANKFAYKLEGIDKDWISAENQRSVSYATLSPGRYHFLVKAAGSDGIGNDIPAGIHFDISTPWWRTWWFFTIAGLFVFAVLYSIYQFRISQLKKVFAVRTKISQDLHDEVGATLTSISFLSEVAKQQKENEDVFADETIEKIGEFSRDMIGEMNDIVWAINPANDKFEKIEARMQNFASTLLAAKNIQLNYRSDGQIKNIVLGMQQRKNLYLIFKEAVNNAAKYSGCSEVNVSVFKEDPHIQLGITDNGKGFVVNEGIAGNGLSNMRLRAAEVNAKILIESQPGKGTHISVSIPITQNAY